MIKQPWMLVVSAVLLLVAIGLGIERTLFVLGSAASEGKVARIDSENSRCGSKKSRYDCTVFSAMVQYAIPSGAILAIRVGAGSTRGNNQPSSSASRSIGDRVGVLYSEKNPVKAYENTIFGVWGAPLIAVGAQIATMLGSLTEGRRRRGW